MKPAIGEDQGLLRLYSNGGIKTLHHLNIFNDGMDSTTEEAPDSMSHGTFERRYLWYLTYRINTGSTLIPSASRKKTIFAT